jgi:hypothetical protein
MHDCMGAGRKLIKKSILKIWKMDLPAPELGPFSPVQDAKPAYRSRAVVIYSGCISLEGHCLGINCPGGQENPKIPRNPSETHTQNSKKLKKKTQKKNSNFFPGVYPLIYLSSIKNTPLAGGG